MPVSTWIRIAIVLLLAPLACGGGDAPPPAAAGGGSGGGGGGEQAAADAAPPVPCAILSESGETSKVFGQPPDNARANDVTLEQLPDRAASLEGQLVRTTGIIEAVGRGGKWVAINDPLFDGWGWVVIREAGVQIPAGATGCAVTVEGTIERVREAENEVELQKREGRPEETIPEEGPTTQILVSGMEVKPPPTRQEISPQ